MSKTSVLEKKRILAVDDEADVLDVLKGEIGMAAPGCTVDTAGSFERAVELLASWTYDLVILDIMGVRGFDILKRVAGREARIPVVMLTAHSLTPEAMKKSIELGARAYLPKERLGALVPFLEDVLTHEYGSVWRRVLKQCEGVFSKRWGAYWRKPDEVFWNEFEEKISRSK